MKKLVILLFTAVLAISCSQQAIDANRLINAIPDHEIKAGTESCFTSEYYALLKEAWAIPSDYIEGIGSEEWLYYFISGNGDVENPEPPKIETISSNEIVFEYLDQKHTITLAQEHGEWVIADFDNTKEQLKEYIARQREYFKSEEWQKALNEFSPENAKTSRKQVETYFREYPN